MLGGLYTAAAHFRAKWIFKNEDVLMVQHVHCKGVRIETNTMLNSSTWVTYLPEIIFILAMVCIIGITTCYIRRILQTIPEQTRLLLPIGSTNRDIIQEYNNYIASRKQCEGDEELVTCI